MSLSSRVHGEKNGACRYFRKERERFTARSLFNMDSTGWRSDNNSARLRVEHYLPCLLLH